MKLFLTVLFLICSFFAVSQDFLILSNSATGESYAIKEGKRVRVKLENGEKRSGVLKIDRSGVIRINNLVTPLDRVVKIKRHPFILTAVFSVITGYFAAGTIGVGAIIATFGGEPVAGIAISVLAGGPLTYASITGINVMRAFKVSKGWEYSVQLE